MEKSRRRRVVAVALTGVALASFAVANFASALTSKGARQSGVFAKVYGHGTWIDLTTEWQTLLSLKLPNIPVSAYYYVVCDGYVYMNYAEIKIAIGVDSPIEDVSTRRFHYGIDQIEMEGIHTERTYYLKPGQHTFYLLGQIYEGPGYARLNYHTITVIVFTDGSLTELPATAEVCVPPDGVSG